MFCLPSLIFVQMNLYPLVRPFAAIAIKVFFRKIYLSNMDRVPSDRPVILAANHPTAFMEPCILACFMDRPLHFLVRGDFFKKNVFATLLRALNMLPVYRLRDGGYQGLKNNFSTFEECYRALAEGKTLMILAEGTTKHEKRLRPLRKGAARIALGALEQTPDLDIAIVPVGANFTYADRFRSDVMIDFGTPIPAKEFFAEYQKNPNKAIGTLTEVLAKELKKSVIIIEEEADEELCEDLFVLNRSERLMPHWPVIIRDGTALEEEKKLADQVNEMSDGTKSDLAKQVRHYFNQLQALHLKDKTVIRKALHFSQDGLILLFGLFPFLVGYIFNYLPLRAAKFIADTQVKAIEFYAPVMVAVGVGIYLLYSIAWLVIAVVFFSWELLLFILSIPFLGLWSLYYLEVFDRFRQSWLWRNLSTAVQEKMTTLRVELMINDE